MRTVRELKMDFDRVKTSRGDILNVFEALKAKLSVLKNIHADLLKTHSKQQFMFGIDSLHFQNNMIEFEYNHLRSTFKQIEGRMYCEYYKLYGLINEYVSSDLDSSVVKEKITMKKNYPTYKSLDPITTYDFKLVAELQDHLTNCILELETYRLARESKLDADRGQSEMGLNIDNLVNCYRHSNALLNERITMFSRFLEAFNQHHAKYFTHLKIRANIVLGIINEDIKLKQFNAGGSSGSVAKQMSGLGLEVDTSSPPTTMPKDEEENLKRFVKYDSADGEMRSTIDNIVSHIPSSDSSRETNPEDGSPPARPTASRVEVEDVASRSDEMALESEIGDPTDAATCEFTEDDIGKRVMIDGYDSVGTLKFVGKHHERGSLRCGVELDEPVGRNDGSINGHKYFDAAPKRGVLCAPQKVSLIDAIDVPSESDGSGSEGVRLDIVET